MDVPPDPDQRATGASATEASRRTAEQERRQERLDRAVDDALTRYAEALKRLGE